MSSKLTKEELVKLSKASEDTRLFNFNYLCYRLRESYLEEGKYAKVEDLQEYLDAVTVDLNGSTSKYQAPLKESIQHLSPLAVRFLLNKGVDTEGALELAEIVLKEEKTMVVPRKRMIRCAEQIIQLLKDYEVSQTA